MVVVRIDSRVAAARGGNPDATAAVARAGHLQEACRAVALVVRLREVPPQLELARVGLLGRLDQLGVARSELRLLVARRHILLDDPVRGVSSDPVRGAHLYRWHRGRDSVVHCTASGLDNTWGRGSLTNVMSWHGQQLS